MKGLMLGRIPEKTHQKFLFFGNLGSSRKMHSTGCGVHRRPGSASLGSGQSVILEQWFYTLLTLQTFNINTHFVVTPNYKIIFIFTS